MASSTLSRLFKLPRSERLAIAESLWISAVDENNFKIPKDHKQVLDDRLTLYRSGKSKPIPHDKLMHRVRSG